MFSFQPKLRRDEPETWPMGQRNIPVNYDGKTYQIAVDVRMHPDGMDCIVSKRGGHRRIPCCFEFEVRSNIGLVNGLELARREMRKQMGQKGLL